MPKEEFNATISPTRAWQENLRDSRGFTTIELLIVVLISLIAAAFAIPSYTTMTRYLRIAGDARDLNSTTAQAKMRAAQDFTHARVYADLAANTFHLEVWDKTANSGPGCWKTEGDSVNRCTSSSSPVQSLSQGIVFGFGSASAGLPNPQPLIAQAPACSSGVAGGTTASSISNTACVEFNSHGLPVAATGSPTASDALYITDSNSVYGVTIIISGLIQDWTTSASSTAWQAR
jgi:prepilin-type N-terminal cleavage/methylation domain-containing protein